MTRRTVPALAPPVVEEPAECLLCGSSTPVFADPDVEDGLAVFDLCGRCNRAFVGLARDVETWATADDVAVPAVVQVAGQLELSDADLDALIGGLEAERAGGYRARPEEARQVLDALRRGGAVDMAGRWADGIPTTALDAVLQDDRDASGALLDAVERRAIRSVLRNRA